MRVFGGVLLGEGREGIGGVRSQGKVCYCDDHSCQCAHTEHLLNLTEFQEDEETPEHQLLAQVCGVHCSLLLVASFTLLALLSSLSVFCYRRQRRSHSKYQEGAISQDYHNSLHQTSSISTINTNCTNNR